MMKYETVWTIVDFKLMAENEKVFSFKVCPRFGWMWFLDIAAERFAFAEPDATGFCKGRITDHKQEPLQLHPSTGEVLSSPLGGDVSNADLTCAGYFVHPPGFVWLTATLRSVMTPSRVSVIFYRNPNTKNRPSKVGFLSSLAQKVTSCGPALRNFLAY